MPDTQQRPGRKPGEQAPKPWRVEGHPEHDREQQPRPPMVPPPMRRFWWIVIALFALNFVLSFALTGKPARTSIPYSLFYKQVQQGNVSEISSKGEEIQGDFKKVVKYPAGKDAKDIDKFQTVRPAFGDDGLANLLIKQNVTVNAHKVESGTPLWQTIIFGFGPTILLVGLFIWLMRRAAASGGGGMLGSFGRSTAKRYEHSSQRTTFKDVAGIDEAEDELIEVVDFLRNPDRYRKVGGAIPKGVLLAGPPGTGKTLLARAVAGEADVPFFSISASEFIEAIVGVGASRVRDLFAQAKAAAPAIIFIDELDAIGRSRGGGVSFGGNDEREQTLNQILTEMDGFTGNEGVIVLGATNRPEILDRALLRPGRFDRRVFVNPPDKDGREAILKVHTRSVPLDDSVDLGQVASTTPGMVGADLRNLVNEAALTAARRDHERVTASDFSDALEKIVLGTERKITLSAEERERTAYHESGHAILGMLEPGADPVRKVSIIPRGQALGVTFQSPESDRYGYGAAYLRGRIVGALGGRAS
jgi:cell division protease FtsH